jgi:uncharacterized protein YbjT (DUF2867 family)
MTVLVIGATGKTGRPLVAALAERGVDVRAASRTPDGPGAIRFDWADRDSWAPALRGADGLYLVGPVGQAGGDGLVPELLAAAADVRRVVLLSVLGADRLPAVVPMAAWERDVRASGKDWTVLRPNWFQQNFGTGFRAALRDTGELALPAGDAAVSFVDTRDVAEVAAAALTGDGHAGRVYELTGPEAFTHPEALAVLGAAAGRELRYVPLDPAGHADRMRAAGVPDTVLRRQAALFALMRDGADAVVTDTVERVTGHPARSLAAYARENAGGWQK